MINDWLALWSKPYMMWSILDVLLFMVPLLPLLLPIIFWPFIRLFLRTRKKQQ